MTEFVRLGGVGIMGYISPMNQNDTYAVIDPLYGIDGLRNVETISDMLDIPEERRRAGMIVGVLEEDKYYKLKNDNWVGDITDWMELNLTGTGGLQSAPTLNTMIYLPEQNRVSGMISYVSEEDKYYKLNEGPWANDLTDWTELYLVGVNEKQSDYSYSDKEIPDGPIDGTNHIFTLLHAPILNSEHIYLNGLLQEIDFDYVINDEEIAFIDPPLSGMRIRCSYRY
jgi:hypothetical protein